MHRFSRSLLAFLGLVLCMAVHAQPTHLDSLYWDTLMTRRINELLRAPLSEIAVTIHRTTKEYGEEDLQVKTVEVAILLLGDPALEAKSIERLYDFLDSAAVYFHRKQTPLFLMSGDAGIRGTQWFLDRERELGVLYMYSGLDCVRDQRQSNGEDLFNLRTACLVEQDKHPNAAKELKELRKRFVEDEQHRRKMDRAIAREMRQ